MAMQTRKRQEILEKAKENIIRAQQQQKEVYNRKHYSPEVYKLGSVVLKKDFSRKKRKGGKLDEKWLGPFTIVGMLGRGLYRCGVTLCLFTQDATLESWNSLDPLLGLIK